MYEPYTYSVEPEQVISKPKPRRRFLRSIALLLVVMLVAFGGGSLGTVLIINHATHGELVDSFLNSRNGGDNSEDANPTQSGVPVAASQTPRPAANGNDMSLPDLFDYANPAVVAIFTEVTGYNGFGQSVDSSAAGSGFLISEDGYIVTNNHVVESARSVSVTMSDGKKYDAEVIGADAQTDVAVIRIKGTNLPYLQFGDSDTMRVGEQVAAIGNPTGDLSNTFTVGYLSAKGREINVEGLQQQNMLQTDTAINPGNSGGPLLNLRGQVIGIVSAKNVGEDIEGLGFAIPASIAESIAQSLISDGYISGRAYMGVTVDQRQDRTGYYLAIASVDKNSAADKAGVQVDDIILSANGKDVYQMSDLKSILSDLAPGDKLSLKVERGRQTLTLTLTLGEYKPS